MDLLKLIKKYPEVDVSILKEYKEAEKFLWLNTDDPDLIPIEIKLPQCPDYHLIQGFGLPAEQQKWRPPKIPKRLKELERSKDFETLDELWDYLEENQEYYKEEIDFINKVWFHRLNGFWFFNNGLPTYIDGWQYFYIAWWNIDIGGLPYYRDRDRKFFLFARYCYTDTKTFKTLDEDGFAVAKKNGKYEFIELGRRVCWGFNYPKHRREGATYKAECINYEIISRTESAWGGIQSMNEKSAEKCFKKHLISPWKKLPFFFKPNYEGSTDPKSILSFNPPATRLSSRGSIIRADIGLESMINFGAADSGEYDGDKLYFHHDDEVGKLKPPFNCWERHRIVKESLSIGNVIIGFTIKTSTVGEMVKGGGKRFEHQCKMSNFHRRNLNGNTVSGLYTLFIPADEGLEGFIDEYGNSVTGTPTKKQALYINNNIGAREYLFNRRKGFIEEQDFEGLSEEIRLYPTKFRECFKSLSKGSGFNQAKLESRLDELRFKKSGKVRGTFRWVKNERDTRVEFVANPSGRFYVSHQLNEDESNLKYWDEFIESWMPGNTHWGVAGGDPFKFQVTEGSKKSKGAGAVVRKGKLKDDDFTMKRRFVCTYSNRVYDKFVYAEEMLMMCVYFGVKMFPEINYDLLWDYFDQRGYKAFLQYRIDPKTFQLAKTPGANTSVKIAQDIFSEWMMFVENEIEEEVHDEILEEVNNIDGPEEMTLFDLFTAGGYALLGTRSIYDEIEDIEKEEKNMDIYFKKRKYPPRS